MTMKKKINMWIFAMMLVLVASIGVRGYLSISEPMTLKGEHFIYYGNYDEIDNDRRGGYISIPIVVDAGKYKQVREVRLGGIEVPFILESEKTAIDEFISGHDSSFGIRDRIIRGRKLGPYLIFRDNIKITGKMVKEWVDKRIDSIHELEVEQVNGKVVTMPIGNIYILEDENVDYIAVDSEKEKIVKDTYRNINVIDIAKMKREMRYE